MGGGHNKTVTCMQEQRLHLTVNDQFIFFERPHVMKDYLISLTNKVMLRMLIAKLKPLLCYIWLNRVVMP